MSDQAAAAEATVDPSNLDAILGIPVSVQVVLGGATMPVARTHENSRAARWCRSNHRVGQPVDVVVNGRTIARGEMVVVDEEGSRLGVSLTEIVGQKGGRGA